MTGEKTNPDTLQNASADPAGTEQSTSEQVTATDGTTTLPATPADVAAVETLSSSTATDSVAPTSDAQTKEVASTPAAVDVPPATAAAQVPTIPDAIAPVNPVVLGMMRDYFARQKQCQDTGRFDVIGEVARLETPKGFLDFPSGARFALAITTEKRSIDGKDSIMDEGGMLIAVEPWPGTPPVLLPDLDTICTVCAIPCGQCNATGKCICQVCGGSKACAYSTGQCQADGCAEKAGRFNPECKTCFGTGSRKIAELCKNCDDEGKSKCYGCNGTGKRPTGNAPGTDMNAVTAGAVLATPCPACNGKMRSMIEKPQDLTAHISTIFEGYTLIGPVQSFLLQRQDFSDKNGLVAVDVKPNKDGYPMMLVLERNEIGSPVYVMNGELDHTAFSSGHGKRFGK